MMSAKWGFLHVNLIKNLFWLLVAYTRPRSHAPHTLTHQAKALRVDIRDAKDALQTALTSLADQWARFEALHAEHEQLLRDAAANRYRIAVNAPIELVVGVLVSVLFSLDLSLYSTPSVHPVPVPLDLGCAVQNPVMPLHSPCSVEFGFCGLSNNRNKRVFCFLNVLS